MVMSFSNTDSLTSFFQFKCLFVSYQIAIARISNTMVSKSGENVHPCFVPYLRGKIFSSFPLGMKLAVGLSYGLYHVEVYFLIPTLFRLFITNRCLT